ncbi:TIGR02646 family protein [Chryseobacterium arachidis]|uniref:TIGR02646 family protein n=1 Tax=Chryseobacterium arachidis TaxID=1416778 RepID=A0A1M4XWX8_9FLAO|nr:hypothetical protein [Chryseobacterium arachidis]SHE97940.1 TIGR02646 family protein [Chryseobacterium arachidis]
MINIQRRDCPDILKTDVDPESDGVIETKDAILYFSDVTNHQTTYKKTGARGARIKEGYSVYKDKCVRKTLLEMFQGKCAYCESKIITIYNGDIEHFRPKGEIQEAKPSKPGYYWLAAEWENLLFACPFCNQTNTHEINNDGDIEESVLGKLDQFPLVSETHRLNHSHGSLYFANRAQYLQAFNLEETERLLLNPCLDTNVSRYFKYDDNGAIIVNDGLSDLEQQKAGESIRVYALHRLNLVIARSEKIIQIKAQIKRVENAIKNFNDNIEGDEEKRTWFEGIMREEMQILKKYKDPDQEYAALARYIIDKYFDEAKFI